MSPEAQAESQAKAEAMIAEMPFHELRAARQMTQENLAEVLGIRQAAVSKMERQTDIYVSTLARFIEAMGGQLEIRAVFPEGAVRISRFGNPEKAA